MANEWNNSYPIDHTLISAVPGEIRKLKTSAKAQLSLEHETPVDGDLTGSEHSSGSAVSNEGTSTPTTRPGGATLGDNAIDRGRLWLDDNFDPPVLKRWDGSAWEVVGYNPGVMSGGNDSIGTVTFPNGLIWKWGKTTRTGATTTVTFAVAFPTACFQAIACGGQDAGSTITYDTQAHTITASSFKILATQGVLTPMRWFAIGR